MLIGSSLKFAIAMALMQAGVALPADPRLDPVRPQLQALVDKSAEAGLPADLLVSKVREGLAKGVPADRIEAAAGRMAEGLSAAQGFVRARHPGQTPPPELVRALAEARLAGVELSSLDPVVRGGAPGPATARAVEVVTDLSLRGYPTSRALALVTELHGREPAAVGRLPATLDVLRREQALSHAEAVDALSRGLKGGASLETASVRAAEARRGAGQGKSKQGGGDSEAGGKEGFVPPGQLKKQSGAKGRPAETPGRGMGMGPKK
jgi:hypothetical protein